MQRVPAQWLIQNTGCAMKSLSVSEPYKNGLFSQRQTVSVTGSGFISKKVNADY
jgi:hypothetical protein